MEYGHGRPMSFMDNNNKDRSVFEALLEGMIALQYRYCLFRLCELMPGKASGQEDTRTVL